MSNPKQYEIGSQPPDGYVARQVWAEVQYKSGLRQERCDQCGLFHFPQESCDKITSPPANNGD